MIQNVSPINILPLKYGLGVAYMIRNVLSTTKFRPKVAAGPNGWLRAGSWVFGQAAGCMLLIPYRITALAI